jgi:hypothetical protein
MSVESITNVFEKSACGDRFREEEERGMDYLALTLAKVVTDKEKEVSVSPNFEGELDGLYYTAGKTRRHVATFTFTPERLLNVVGGGEGSNSQALMGAMTTVWETTEDVVLPREAFNSVRAMQRELRLVSWQWLGTDKTVREYLPYLVAILGEIGMPATTATTVLGYCDVGEEPCYVFDGWTLTKEGLTSGHSRPVIYVDTGKEHTRYYGERQLGEQELRELREDVAGLLPKINTPEVVWPTLGWFMATPLKVQLGRLGYKFPTLGVFGTRGAGKTTLIQNVMLRLLGVVSEGGGVAASYDAGTTKFVTLALLGGSNCVPIPFSEFREHAVSAFLRYVRLAYDSGRDPRGKPDQTTVNYPLTAPFVMDGEDRISDPAAVERTIAVGLDPSTIAEYGACHSAYTELSKLPLSELAQDIYTWCLGVDVGTLLREAERIVGGILPETLPDRIRRNVVVCAMGLLVAEQCLPVEVEWAALREVGLTAVSERGRTLVSADAFIEELANVVGTQRATFANEVTEGGSTVLFQFSPAYNWWVSRLRRRGVGGPLAQSSIRRQLVELSNEEDPYIAGPSLVKGRYMWGLSLERAQAAGLDVPKEVRTGPKLKVKTKPNTDNDE